MSWIAIIILSVLAIFILIYVIGVYNRLVTHRNRYKNAFSQIDVQLKRRNDLIPNLVETAKGYMAHEKDTLEAVIQARNQAVTAGQQAARKPGDPEAMNNLSGAENMLTGALGKLFALSEAYPDLKANQNMLSLQEELSSTENRIAFARQAYNDAVTTYNTRRETFPAVVFSDMMGFEEANLFEVEEPRDRDAPKVSFS